MRSKTFQRILDKMEKDPWHVKLKRWWVVNTWVYNNTKKPFYGFIFTQTFQIMIRTIFGITALLIFIFCWESCSKDSITAKVQHLEQQNLYDGSKNGLRTNVRYIIVTDKETFICENSIAHMKFNNSDIFFRLKIDSTYVFNVTGFGKSFFTDYRNVLSIKAIP